MSYNRLSLAEDLPHPKEKRPELRGFRYRDSLEVKEGIAMQISNRSSRLRVVTSEAVVRPIQPESDQQSEFEDLLDKEKPQILIELRRMCGIETHTLANLLTFLQQKLAGDFALQPETDEARAQPEKLEQMGTLVQAFDEFVFQQSLAEEFQIEVFRLLIDISARLKPPNEIAIMKDVLKRRIPLYSQEHHETLFDELNEKMS